ncbi:MAG: hypothetical protein DHS20C12_12360 [Pseudohongiella sp.]|nr:MAG: hypothetical protein DHS20C12_12360 [Pseudohongiella sp.]
MIFSLLKIRKKTAAVLAGIACGLACVWVVAAWQDISMAEILNMLLGSVLLLGGIMLLAFCLVAGFSLLKKLLSSLRNSD